jgi:uncharacterized protein YjdB
MDDCGTITLSDEVAQGGGLVKKTDVAPKIDGEVDAVWENANTYNIVVPFRTEVATVGDAGETTWKALWDAEGMYILVQVGDDNWLPYWAPGGGANGYEYDKVELYFDTNQPRKDGKGGQAGTPGSTQIAPDSKDGGIDGELLTGTAYGVDYKYAIKVSDPKYVAEYFIPWDILNDKDGVAFDKTGQMGFDVTVIDRDPGDPARKRVNWANAGAIDENWNNMDDAGIIMFDGASEVIMVEKIKVSGGNAITTNKGTLQLTATVEPADATSQKVKWVVENQTGEASVSKDGLVTAIKDGTVLVKAVATDGSFVEGKVTVTISGQVITKDDIWNTFNKISNWNFSEPQTGQFPASWGGWIDLAGMAAGAADPVTEDGVVAMRVGLATDANNWHYQLNQSNLTCAPFEPYTFKFKTWATADGTPCVVDFEDTSGNNYNRYGASSDAEANGGRSEWHYTADIAPKWYTFHVTFDQMVDNTVQKVQWMNSLSNETIYLDSVLLVKDADLALKVNSLAKDNSKVQLYPNPVQNELTVSKISVANSKVSVYNAIGQKMIEKTANGTVAKFDVTNFRKGMYFVRFSDGTSEKFIKQ